MLKTKVYPVPGRLARHPETGEIVPPEGLEVFRAGYWLRRILDGDVSERSQTATAKTKDAAGDKKE